MRAGVPVFPRGSVYRRPRNPRIRGFLCAVGCVARSRREGHVRILLLLLGGTEQDGPNPGCSATTPEKCLADYRGKIVVEVTYAPEIALDPSSVAEMSTENSIDVSFLGFQDEDMVSFSVGEQCGTDGTLDLDNPPTVTIGSDGTATTTLSVTAGSVTQDTRCTVVATGTTEIWDRVDTVEATVTVKNTSGEPEPEPEPVPALPGAGLVLLAAVLTVRGAVRARRGTWLGRTRQ